MELASVVKNGRWRVTNYFGISYDYDVKIISM
jgi:hypothetical protein